MQFAEQHKFDITFKVAKLQAEAVSGNLCPSSAIECAIRAQKIKQRNSCELILICRLRNISFAYVEVQLNNGNNNNEEWRGVVHRFDSESISKQEKVLCEMPLPTIGNNSHFLATNLRIGGVLHIEVGCSADAFVPDGFSDVTFTLGDSSSVELHLHRSVLAKCSPVFQAMLLGKFKESDSSTTIHLPDKSPSLFIELLSTLYPPQLEIHHARAKTLLPLYAEYQIDHMLMKCERAMLHSPLYSQVDASDPEVKLPHCWMEELMEHAFLGALYHLNDLRDKAIEQLANVRTGECEKAMRDLLPDEILSRIFARRVNILENTIQRLNDELDSYKITTADN